MQDDRTLTGANGGDQEALIAGRYEIRRRIGQGGMGEVFEGYDHTLQRRVALKRPPREAWMDLDARGRLLAEAQLQGRLRHPHIVTVLDAVDEGVGKPVWIVMDYVDGRSIKDLIRSRGRIEPERAASIGLQVASALGAAHRASIVHRDLKPSNIMMDANGWVYVLDFGIARLVQQTIVTLTGRQTSGTPLYMAPEQHIGGRYAKDRRVDVFAFGAVLYEMVTGEAAYAEAANPVMAKERKSYVPAGEIVPALPEGLVSIIDRCLEPETEERFAGFEAVAEALRGAFPALVLPQHPTGSAAETAASDRAETVPAEEVPGAPAPHEKPEPADQVEEQSDAHASVQAADDTKREGTDWNRVFEAAGSAGQKQNPWLKWLRRIVLFILVFGFPFGPIILALSFPLVLFYQVKRLAGHIRGRLGADIFGSSRFETAAGIKAAQVLRESDFRTKHPRALVRWWLGTVWVAMVGCVFLAPFTAPDGVRYERVLESMLEVRGVSGVAPVFGRGDYERLLSEFPVSRVEYDVQRSGQPLTPSQITGMPRIAYRRYGLGVSYDSHPPFEGYAEVHGQGSGKAASAHVYYPARAQWVHFHWGGSERLGLLFYLLFLPLYGISCTILFVRYCTRFARHRKGELSVAAFARDDVDLYSRELPKVKRANRRLAWLAGFLAVSQLYLVLFPVIFPWLFRKHREWEKQAGIDAVFGDEQAIS